MRIPLDYYRILGLPIQATVEQLRQAHRDRTLQLPRREYSEAAIAARKQLIDEAYSVLSDPEQRQAYDANFLARSYGMGMESLAEGDRFEPAVATAAPAADPYTPSIEIQDQQLVGALLILLELGEYELVLKIGRPYLNSGHSSLNSGRFGQPDIVLADIVLTIAFACLELGREQWQQGQYEQAAESLEIGRELLLREGLFASVRGEMQADLFKLRPYRILELLALPEENEAERRQGMNLLRDMLQDRGGIDGNGNDESGLSVDDFLRFIQQLRSYLTSAEQQALFEAEARRPSAVATYLAVYALLTRGFAYQQPALIRRAKLMLLRLGTRQDVHLEQAVCALLLGQTEEASHALELSQEYESIGFIRDHSQGSPDLLPGLCLYAERWLQNEVFPHFRDLANQQAMLKDYFANEQVQAYLEELPNEPEPASQWTVAQSPAMINNGQNHRRNPVDFREASARVAGQSRPSATAYTTSTATATLDAQSPYSANGGATMHTAERISHLSPEGRLNGKLSGEDDRKRGTGNTNKLHMPQPAQLPLRRFSSHRSAPRLDRIMFMIAIAVLGLGIVMVSFNRLTRANNASASEQLRSGLGTLSVQAEPFLAPDPNAPLTNETAQQVIETWLKTKAAAMGSNHAIDGLPKILADPLLTTWRNQAEQAKSGGWYNDYQHQVRVSSVTPDEGNPDQAKVEAAVVESIRSYRNGQSNGEDSGQDTLQVQYNLIRQDGQWRIQAIAVLP